MILNICHIFDNLPMKSLTSLWLYDINGLCMPDYCEVITLCPQIKRLTLFFDEGCEDDYLLLQLLKILKLEEIEINLGK